MYNTYCFSTATMVARTRLSVTLCAHCLPGLYCAQIIISLRISHLWFSGKRDRRGTLTNRFEDFCTNLTFMNPCIVIQLWK